MTEASVGVAAVDRDELRRRISDKYRDVAMNPEIGFHVHNGRPLSRMLGYPDEVIEVLPWGTVESFAGTGNPFVFGDLDPGESVLDLGCGAGFDTLIAARHVGAGGKVLAVDMTEEMLAKTAAGAAALGFGHVETRNGFAESLPLEDDSVDVIISNGVINLCPDKPAVFQEMARVLRPGGRIQVGDILVHSEVPQDAKDDIELWSG